MVASPMGLLVIFILRGRRTGRGEMRHLARLRGCGRKEGRGMRTESPAQRRRLGATESGGYRPRHAGMDPDWARTGMAVTGSGRVPESQLRGPRYAYRPALDGVRALAVVGVLLFH